MSWGLVLLDLLGNIQPLISLYFRRIVTFTSYYQTSNAFVNVQGVAAFIPETVHLLATAAEWRVRIRRPVQINLIELL